MNSSEEIDLYDVLGILPSASKSEVKKAYHKAALTCHPDKVPDSERADAEPRFKAVLQAYEILYDDEKRHLYDAHGMAAFDPRAGMGGMGGDGDMNDILEHLFGGMSMGGGFHGAGGGPGGPGRGMKKRGKDEVQTYEVSLEELYKGKTTRFASTKKVVCGTCHGTGSKEKAKPAKCTVCGGKGQTLGIRQVGPMQTQVVLPCATCKSSGQIYKDKDKCKKCKGNRVVEQKKVLELYIPRGSREGERIVLSGEADQMPDQEPGDIIFELVETEHETFNRAGQDLQADIHITLSEALTGFNRVVLTHLDGRGIQIRVDQQKGKILRPGEVLKVHGEGMPIKTSDAKGDLYLIVKVEFPKDGWIQNSAMVDKIRAVLPEPPTAPTAELVEEVEFEADADLCECGASSGDPLVGGEWEDEDEEHDHAQCPAQ